MASKKISELPAGTTPTGAELAEGVQGGVNKQFTFQDIADLGGGAVDSVNGQTGVVVLDATDVGADPTGSAATVASNLAAHIADGTDAHAGSAITNTPAGNIAATTVQGAINELDSEKASLTGTETLTNKRITPRIQSVTSSATVTPNADSDDAVKITAQAANLTLANPSGTPTAMQGLLIRIKDNGTARTITYGSQYRAIGVTLPTTTVISKTIYLGLVWNSDDSKWDIIGYSIEQ